MEINSEAFLKNLKEKAAKKNTRINTRDQILADEIYSYFSKRIKFGQIMGMIKLKGWQGVYDAFSEVKKERRHIDDPTSLFIFKVKDQKVQWVGDKKTAAAGNP